MPNFGDIAFTALYAYVSAYDPVAKTFGVPALLEYIQDASEEAEHDTDDIKAQGANREGLSVHIGTNITVGEASMSDAAVDVITGENSSLSGASGNRVRKRIRAGGGDGLPYFGIAFVFAATNGARYVFGAPKCKCGNKPQFEGTQNSFRTGEISMKAYAIDGLINNIDKQTKYEDSSDVPDFSQQADFQTFFDELLS